MMLLQALGSDKPFTWLAYGTVALIILLIIVTVVVMISRKKK